MRILNAALKESMVDASVVLTICVLMSRQAFCNEMKEYIDIIMEKNFIYESVQLLAKVSHPQFDIMKLLNKCQEIGNERLLGVITQFIKEKSL